MCSVVSLLALAPWLFYTSAPICSDQPALSGTGSGVKASPSSGFILPVGAGTTVAGAGPLPCALHMRVFPFSSESLTTALQEPGPSAVAARETAPRLSASSAAASAPAHCYAYTLLRSRPTSRKPDKRADHTAPDCLAAPLRL